VPPSGLASQQSNLYNHIHTAVQSASAAEPPVVPLRDEVCAQLHFPCRSAVLRVQEVLTVSNGGLRTMVLNRPKALNAITLGMVKTIRPLIAV
jgi:hypothetical protein